MSSLLGANAGGTHSNLGGPSINLRPSWQSGFTSGEFAYLQAGGVIYHFGWKWRGGSIRVGPCFDAAEGEREFLATLFEAGYRLPRWWQMSRWGEKRLSKDRRKVIAEMEARDPS